MTRTRILARGYCPPFVDENWLICEHLYTSGNCGLNLKNDFDEPCPDECPVRKRDLIIRELTLKIRSILPDDGKKG